MLNVYLLVLLILLKCKIIHIC